MKKAIRVELMPEAERFILDLDEKNQHLFLRTFRKVEAGFKDNDIFKKLDGSKDIWEFRVKDYRMLAFWDGEGEEITLIICTHGFQKKRDKVPKSEIEKAERLKQKHFNM